MPFSPISIRQINLGELSGFAAQFFSIFAVATSGNQTISGEKTFLDTTIFDGGIIYGRTQVNSNYTVSPLDYLLSVSCTSPRTITFPSTGFVTGKEFLIKDFLGQSESFPITITGNGVTFDYQNSLTVSGNFASIYLVGGSGTNYEVN